MDNVIFHGERDEHTRRQVRSAAAAHSHRIGPRKPKTTGKQSHGRASSNGSNSSSSNNNNNNNNKKGETMSRRRAMTRPVTKPGRATGASKANSHNSSSIVEMPPAPSIAGYPQGTQHVWGRAGRLDSQVHGMGMLNHPHQPPSVLTRRRPEETHNGSERRALYRAHQPTIMKKRSADTRKLPVYSWTEYPRYTLGSSYPREALEMLADAAASARGMPRSSVPAEWAGGAMLDLHHFTTSADGRPLLPPLPPLMPPLPSLMPPPPPLVAVEGGGHAPMKVETADLAPPRHHFRAPPCAEFTSDTPPSKTSPAPPSISPG